MTLQWLKDSNNEYSYARVVGCVCILTNIVCLFRSYEEINNVYQVIVGCSGFITGCVLWLCEIIRDSKNITLKIAGKEYEYKREK